MPHRPSSWLIVACLVLISAAAAGCAATRGTDGSGGGDTTGSSTAQGGGDISGSGGAASTQAIQITPQNPTLTIELGLNLSYSIQFTATSKASGQPVKPVWSLSTQDAGLIDEGGLFTANGKAGGEIVVTATLGKDTGTATLTITVHALENPGSISTGDQGTLKGPAGPADPNWKLWYPNDKTVFPRGILPPEIHSSPNQLAPTAYYLHIKTTGYEYEGFFGNVPQLQMSQAAWDALGTTSDGGDVVVELSKIALKKKYGPVTQTWHIAKGKLHGTIYYNTYDSPLAGNDGAVMRIKGNSPSPEVLIGGCTVCHSVSSDGSTASAANHSGSGLGGTFDLSGGNLNPPLLWTDAELGAFVALFPKKGDVFVVNAAPGGAYPPNTPGTFGPYSSALRSKTGMVIPASGIEGYYAQTPVFSHDGTMLAFVDRTPSGSTPSKLALMHYDAASQKFSSYEVLAAPPDGTYYSWPAFTPDNKYVVVQKGNSGDLATWNGNKADLWAINVVSKQAMALASLNGDGYMPQGTRDEDLNFEPTILPIGSGGYFWVMYTSRRTYGNRLTGDGSTTKRLWVSAFDVNATDGVDPTHPGFYIAGQELESGNSRGFWALDPCKQNGSSCESGDECCEGFCNPDPADPRKFTCSPPSGGCSDEFENCATSGDCCDSALQCIGGKCTLLPPS